MLDFKVTPVVTATLRYDDTQANIHKVDTFAFTEPNEASWSFQIADDSRRTYRSLVTYNTADGQEIQTEDKATDQTVFVIPKLLIPEIAIEVHPKMVNFVETPLVEVAINYDDPEHGIHEDETLIFTTPDPQTFRFRVDEDSPRQYNVAVTYYLADGNIIEKPSVALEKSKIVIPRYVAEA
jgi:hypothetical protein